MKSSSEKNMNIDIISDVHSYGLDVKNREIYLHSYIANSDEDPGVDYKMAANFYKNIRLLDAANKNPILIHMHSVGGNWNDGMTMMPHAYFMAHFGSSGYSGNYLDVQKGAAFEKVQTDIMLDVYTDACSEGKYFKEKYTDATHDKVKNYLKRKLKDGDWYLDANESVYYGFADAVLATRKLPSIGSLK